MRYARRKDRNHGQVVSWLRQLGCSVLVVDCSQANAPDLVVGRNGSDGMAEVKPPGNIARTSQLRPGQAEFAEAWRGRDVVVLRTFEDCEALAQSLLYARKCCPTCGQVTR